LLGKSIGYLKVGHTGKAMDLIVCISGEEKSWSHAKKLIEKGEFGRILIIGDEKSVRRFSASKKCDSLALDVDRPATALIAQLSKQLREKSLSFDVGLNLVAGSGKEHMVILASLLRIGVGIRLVALTADGVREL
jgi:hypothetical protein